MSPRPTAFPEDADFRDAFRAALLAHPFSHAPYFTDFLPPWDQALIHAELQTLKQPFHVTAWGGYTLARGSMLGIHPMHAVAEARFPLAWFRADPLETYHQLTRDAVLSALELPDDASAGWGVREVGDVNATEGGWCGVVRIRERAPVGEWAGIRFTAADQGLLEQYPGGRRIVIREGGSVAQPRLDAVAAVAHKPARNQFKTLIENGGAMLNYRPVTKGSAAVALGDVISLRGFLTIRVIDIGQPTKKGRQWVRVESIF